MNDVAPAAPARAFRLLPLLLCLAAIGAHLWLIDLKGISTDEGIRLGIINGGQPCRPGPVNDSATWEAVLDTISPYAYQPAYYLLQNTLMRLADRHDLLFFRGVNIGFLALALLGLLLLSGSWAPWPRAFLIGLFAFNAYLIMHVLQIREYIVAVALYIWGSWLVLRLDRRELQSEWRDIAWFAAYGILLTLGFYLQSWTVFPAIGQGLFLVLRRRAQTWRFLAHLAFSYLLVFSLTWPYLHANQQKVNVGLWETEHVTLLGQLSNGFHLVFSGHVVDHDRFTGFLPWVWLALLLSAVLILLRRRTCLAPEFTSECVRQAWLMGLCISVTVAFQIAYFFKVEPLSVWPRYFVVHYFFCLWLVALAFRLLHQARERINHRVVLTTGLAALSLLLGGSMVYQLRSYRLDPYFDTSLSRESDWREGASLLAGDITTDDVLLSQDFITASTLSFTRPLANRIVYFQDIEKADLGSVRRLVYLEPAYAIAGRAALSARLALLGFGAPREIAHTSYAHDHSPGYWRVLAFQRP